MAPRNVSKQQAEQAEAGEDGESEQGTLDSKAISKDMEKNVGTTRIERPANRYDLQCHFAYDTNLQLTDARPKGPEAQSAICKASARNVRS